MVDIGPCPLKAKKAILVYLRPETHAALLKLSLAESAEAGVRVSASRVVESLIERRLTRRARKRTGRGTR